MRRAWLVQVFPGHGAGAGYVDPIQKRGCCLSAIAPAQAARAIRCRRHAEALCRKTETYRRLWRRTVARRKSMSSAGLPSGGSAPPGAWPAAMTSGQHDRSPPPAKRGDLGPGAAGGDRAPTWRHRPAEGEGCNLGGFEIATYSLARKRVSPERENRVVICFSRRALPPRGGNPHGEIGGHRSCPGPTSCGARWLFERSPRRLGLKIVTAEEAAEPAPPKKVRRIRRRPAIHGVDALSARPGRR